MAGPESQGKVLTEHLEKIIRTREFEPGKREGVPAITKTRLNLNIEAEKNPRGGMEVAILQAHTGVGFNSMPAPSYPTTPAMRGYSAELRLQLDVDQQGKFVSARVLQYVGDSQNKWIRQDFEKASLKAGQSWSFEPEQVAGKPLVSRVSAPVLFCMGQPVVREAERSPPRRRTTGPVDRRSRCARQCGEDQEGTGRSRHLNLAREVDRPAD